MKRFAVTLIILALALPAHARSKSSGYRTYAPKIHSTTVKGHYKPSAGKYIMPHRRTTADRTQYNNWSSKPNVNPYTGQGGTKTPRK